METTPTPGFRKTADTFTAGSRTLLQCYFVSEELLAKEKARIFSAQWLCVGHQSQVANVGDYFVPAVLGESLIILRDSKNTVRGFFNVCRHRGTRLCDENSGQLRETIQCPYHAWTYSLDGKLLGAPHMDKVAGFEKAQHSLHGVSLGLWEGFIFIHLASKPAPLEKVFA